ncbi:MAG: FAS1-like dehydratase domain-containing protein [Vulcanimicrobiaceae bacterium]
MTVHSTQSKIDYESYLNKQERRTDRLDRHRIEDLAALLDADVDAIAPNGILPPLAQWYYFNAWARESELGEDGHPRRGGFMPPITLPRRMFAGGRMTFRAPLKLDEPVERVATIAAIKEKTGASGELVFVTVRHEIFGSAGLAIEEEQDIVYRSGASGAPAKETAEPTPHALTPDAFVKRIHADPVMLFRFSALTSNGHRIHYDRTYATEVEGYPGLVIHGPLQAVLLADLVREKLGRPLRTFSFQARRPLFDTSAFDCAVRAVENGADLMTLDLAGNVCMKASAGFMPPAA